MIDMNLKIYNISMELLYSMIFLWNICTVYSQSRLNIEDLYSDLLNSTYNIHIRPNDDQSQSTNLDFEFTLLSLVDIEESSGKFSVVGYLSLKWIDPRLTWDPVNYGSATNIVLPREKVWRPEFAIANPLSSLHYIGHSGFPIRYSYSGEAWWIVGDLMEVVCEYNVEFFPFDTQTCDIHLNPLGMLETELNVTATHSYIDKSYYREHNEWAIVALDISVDINPGTIFFVDVNVSIRRRWDFFLTSLFSPILIMIILNSFVFALPPESGERTGYALTCLLSMAVFMTLVTDGLPASSRPIPRVTHFVLGMLLLSTIICFFTIITIRCYFADHDARVPFYISRIVFLFKTDNSKTCSWCKFNKVFIKQKRESENNASSDPEVDESQLENKEENTLCTWRDVGNFLDKTFFVLTVCSALFLSLFFFIDIVPKK